MELWEYLLLMVAALIGGGFAYFLKQKYEHLIGLLLSFSGAYILGVVFVHMLPEVYSNQGHLIGIFVLIGYGIQILLEQLSRGIEHGHIHVAHSPSPLFLIAVMNGLCIHAFLEGIPLSGFDLVHDHSLNYLLYGIVFHKIPAAFALTTLLLLSGFKQRLILFCLLFFMIMTPLGGFVSEFLFENNLIDLKWLMYIIAIVIGSFLHIGTTIMFESETKKTHRIDFGKLIAIVIGFILSGLSIH